MEAVGTTRQEEIARSKIQIVAGPSVKERRRPAMLVVELGIWLIPLTLVFVPCRRIVLLLKRLQEFHRSMTQQSLTSADMVSRFSRLNSMALMF
ncbi:hypothetical protein GUJ93_ZPchr0010g9757 [Zizania palustris]|uniref:Uncharacterized protein n=1 Tax=Zizania palustris TaxID=103762 RepID=A0A8J5VTB5_ZIZPA|nr:hypothetical protein GUJ93_ZPchr0010g9757 [Zizania palustris]